jgi:DNA repair protein RadA/Sms
VTALNVARTRTGIDPFDALLGGGFVPGSSILLIGPPGAGKSTLLMQLLDSACVPALYVTGEESVQQLKLRADRLGINARTISLLFETEVGRILTQLGIPPVRILVIDSIQTIYNVNSDTLPGSTTQIRKCAYVLRRTAQQNDIVLVIIGQVTKDKRAAGPKLLEHAVDVVLVLEFDEDRPNLRLLQSLKNRFGSTTSRCAMQMTRTGFVFMELQS